MFNVRCSWFKYFCDVCHDFYSDFYVYHDFCSDPSVSICLFCLYGSFPYVVLDFYFCFYVSVFLFHLCDLYLGLSHDFRCLLTFHDFCYDFFFLIFHGYDFGAYYDLLMIYLDYGVLENLLDFGGLCFGSFWISRDLCLIFQETLKTMTKIKITGTDSNLNKNWSLI